MDRSTVRFTGRTRRVGALHLSLAAVLTGLTGVALSYLLVSGRPVPSILVYGPRYLDGITLLELGGLIDPLRSWLLPLLAGWFLLLAAIELSASRLACRGTRLRPVLLVCVLGASNPLSLPLVGIAGTLSILAAESFEDRPTDEAD